MARMRGEHELRENRYLYRRDRASGLFQWLIEEFAGTRAMRTTIYDRLSHLTGTGVGSTQEEADHNAEADLRARAQQSSLPL